MAPATCRFCWPAAATNTANTSQATLKTTHRSANSSSPCCKNSAPKPIALAPAPERLTAWRRENMNNEMPYPKNAPGDFVVNDFECIQCCAPEHEAPDLM